MEEVEKDRTFAGSQNIKTMIEAIEHIITGLGPVKLVKPAFIFPDDFVVNKGGINYVIEEFEIVIRQNESINLARKQLLDFDLDEWMRLANIFAHSLVCN